MFVFGDGGGDQSLTIGERGRGRRGDGKIYWSSMTPLSPRRRCWLCASTFPTSLPHQASSPINPPQRFNTDPKIFCFILSTRSGGVGMNLVGADTVM